MESDLVHILDGREEPKNLPFALLKNITDNFSEDRVIGEGGFAIVYEVIFIEKLETCMFGPIYFVLSLSLLEKRLLF
jgi:hypothetical protein